jgi:hypothetical protein
MGSGRSLGGLLLGGATPEFHSDGTYSGKNVGRTKVFRKSMSGTVKAERAAARKVESERKKALKKTAGYKIHVRQYQNFLRELAKTALRHLTMEEHVGIEQAIEMGHFESIPYLIKDYDQHVRLLKAKHFPLWAAKEYTFDYGLPRSKKTYRMSPYVVNNAIANEPHAEPVVVPYGPEMSTALVPVGQAYPSYPSYIPRVPRNILSSSFGQPLGLPPRMGRAGRNERGQYVSPQSEEYLKNLQVVPYYES